jgi:hypothetical protein
MVPRCVTKEKGGLPLALEMRSDELSGGEGGNPVGSRRTAWWRFDGGEGLKARLLFKVGPKMGRFQQFCGQNSLRSYGWPFRL